MEKKVRKAVRDIEMLLGPSFPVEMFSKALQQELKLLGITSRLFKLDGYHRLQIENSLEIWISDSSIEFDPGYLQMGQGIWIPHRLLLLPVNQAVA